MVLTALQEYRNSILGRFCCHLTTTRAFASVAHDHMVVGHTHEDIGTLIHSNQYFLICYFVEPSKVAWVWCLVLWISLDAFFGMIAKLIRQGDENMQLDGKGLKCLMSRMFSKFHVLKVLIVFKIPCVELGKLQKIWWRLNLSWLPFHVQCLKNDDFWNLTQPLTLVCYTSVEVAEWSIAGKLQKVWPHLPGSILAVSEELVTNYGKIFNFGWWLPQTKVDGQGWYSTFFYICSPWLTPD